MWETFSLVIYSPNFTESLLCAWYCERQEGFFAHSSGWRAPSSLAWPRQSSASSLRSRSQIQLLTLAQVKSLMESEERQAERPRIASQIHRLDRVRGRWTASTDSLVSMMLAGLLTTVGGVMRLVLPSGMLLLFWLLLSMLGLWLRAYPSLSLHLLGFYL